MSLNPFHLYRRWENRYIAAIDALLRGDPVDPSGSHSRIHAWMVSRLRQRSPTDLRQFRDLLWRYRGWRGWAAFCAVGLAGIGIGFCVWIVAPNKFSPLEAMVSVTLISYGLAAVILTTWFNAPKLAKKGPRYLGLIVLLAAAGACTGALVAMLENGEPLLQGAQRVGRAVLAIGLLIGIAYAAFVSLIATLRNRELTALNAQLLAEAEQERLAHQLARSQLTLLQAQIEPHFLFNTLSTVRQMTEATAPDASQLTANLIHFLRGALTELRRSETTLGEEVALATSYLAIMKVRLGARLTFAVDVPEALRSRSVPPTLLITLVENAIKHGIEGQPTGGTISIRAAATGDGLEIVVEDTGAGMSDNPGHGVGLTNLRAQLALIYGAAARLDLEQNEPHGFIARISLPPGAVS